jgi:hypothetical protein
MKPKGRGELIELFQKLGGEDSIKGLENNIFEKLCSIDRRYDTSTFKTVDFDLSKFNPSDIEDIEKKLGQLCLEDVDEKVYQCSVCESKLFVKKAGTICQACIIKFHRYAGKISQDTIGDRGPTGSRVEIIAQDILKDDK